MKINSISGIIPFQLLIMLFLLRGMTVSGQGNLQFGKVIIAGSSVQNVPAGKVWKVESVIPGFSYSVGSNCSSTSNNGNYGTAIYVNGALYMTDVSYNAGTNYSSVVYNGSRAFPIWLPAGASFATACSSSMASIIEFEIIP